MHSTWHRVRGPFRSVSCDQHTWERFDIQGAGCLMCGAAHECKTHLTDNCECPLAHLRSGDICCTITGYCLPVVRYSKCEYVDHCAAHAASSGRPQHQQVANLADEVDTIVNWFLLGAASQGCKIEEVDRTLARCHAHVVKALKLHKMETAGEEKRCLPCLPAILAQTMHNVKPKHSLVASEELCRFCSQHITKCLLNLNLAGVQAKRVSTVVGLLYLMKQGLTIQNVQWLPRVPSLVNCLPHETCLEKTFKLSMKLVCETENEVKLALRQRVKLL